MQQDNGEVAEPIQGVATVLLVFALAVKLWDSPRL